MNVERALRMAQMHVDELTECLILSWRGSLACHLPAAELDEEIEVQRDRLAGWREDLLEDLRLAFTDEDEGAP